MADVVLKETAVVRIGAVRVGCGNVWERDYELPDGSTKQGMTARVSFDGAVFYAGVGSELTIDGVLYRVAVIEKEPGALGRVHLAIAGKPPAP